ncbi:PREDICTED: uncharacterized protein LOC109333829 isoform X3 [Lupinus angustifolius]|uniref:uncharacterized protein LOC109333829 isoform X3 n=1 Tax=Lupinus angustifolius TaxID=3871 RepID=UPI00092F1161|nr:PREDICTED: uncharacterized protein LOC109333829 isoform X3 [Lupinus angustifolius]
MSIFSTLGNLAIASCWNVMENNQNSATKTDRKLIERNRRSKMKALSWEPFSLSDQLQEATNYIKTLEMKLEKMKDKKNRLLEIQRENMSMNKGGSKPPQIEIQQMGLALVIGLITGLDFQFMFKECIRFLLEEGAYIVSANYIVSGDSFFHTIHCQVEESSNGARISERLKMFVYDSCAFY